jgi:hypothetical protein
MEYNECKNNKFELQADLMKQMPRLSMRQKIKHTFNEKQFIHHLAIIHQAQKKNGA